MPPALPKPYFRKVTDFGRLLRRGIGFAVGTCGVLALATAPAAAEPGLYVSASLGGGYYRATPDYPTRHYREAALPASSLFVGVSVTSHVHVGAGVLASLVPFVGNDHTGLVYAVGPFVDFYPRGTAGLHFQGFAGWGGFDYLGQLDDNLRGPLVMAAAGYDVAISGRLRVGGLARVSVGSFSCCSDPSVTFAVIEPAVLGTVTWQ